MKYFAVPALLCASLFTHGQWELMTPIKTRSQFDALAMVSDAQGYAVDKPMGAILRTFDGGVRWERMANNLSNSPTAIFMWDADRGVVVGEGGAVYRTNDGFNTITGQSNPTFGELRCVHFVNDTLGWAGSVTGKIIRTIDGGVTWTLMQSGQPTNNYMTAIQFVDTETGYASCAGSEMLKSVDGGLTWQGVGPFDQLVLIRDLYFYDTEVGVAVGSVGEVIRTTDGGATWDSIPSNTTYTMLDMDVQGDVIVACGAWGRTIRSTDAGLTWTEIQIGSTDHQSVALSASGSGLLGTNGRIHGTSDMGQTWALRHEGTWHTRLNKVSFMDADTGVAVGWQTTGGFESGLLRTTDGGRNWTKAGAGGLGVHLNAEGDGCLGGSSGAFAKTMDGFRTRTSVSGPSVAIRCTWTIDASTMIVAGGAVLGGIYRTANGGTNWTRVLDVGNITINDLWFVDDLQGYAVGEYGDNYRTGDGGLTWDPMPPTSGSHTVFFADPLHGWTRNFRTVDGGDSWTYMGGTAQNTMSIFFTDPDTGYAVAYSGQVEKSVDGGITWENVLPEILNASVGDATIVDGQIVIVCNNGDIFRARVGCSSTPWIPEVSVDDLTLCTPIDGMVQWYRNGVPVDGGTSACIEALQGGIYTVIVTDELGCPSASSEPVQVLITGVGETMKDGSLRLSPNPANSLLYMERTSDRPATVSFIDVQGRVVKQQRIAGNRSTFDVSELHSGVYLLRVIDLEGISTARIVKQ
ncbi:MAG: T9SS type A sorting domain-containing protein [Flavobacteriales bacterium]|jgi:photosystem II stability/assembly factor-like uncharacterized protein|nr:T9SS type A sorting domain-containing protein [Flavobacteriales bacterium]MBK6550589.1 T9SS type A sorting domain-containing protein [Flavobacteriales bacterium]MBK6884816.1 T9SS type A sorting domain-containing protein [Flavobacteriales bacterium]MBK7102138.1 T9SS type A sorting domain-containing protein [Flavobacteriales bacterium]MBK7112608.1 T9SS type A sorting domain-containing protein [Flavobacteriales bacterium]